MSEKSHQKIQFTNSKGDNRIISYQAWGDPSGKPVLYFHGFPGSHKQAQFLKPTAQKQNVYLIALDRPGYGESSVELANEGNIGQMAIELMDHLKIKKFSVMGVSGGAPSAWQVAFLAPDRIHRLGIVCGLASFSEEFLEDFPPIHFYGLKLFQKIPRTQLHRLMNFLVKPGPPKLKLRFIKSLLPPKDRELFNDPELLNHLVESMTWARQQRGQGIANDLHHFGSDWWQKKGIQVPTYLWHGEKDRIVPASMSKKWKRLLPSIELQLEPEEGHYSLPVNKKAEILEKITEGL